MKKKQLQFVIKPEFVGQTVFDLPDKFPTTWESVHGTYNGEFIELSTDFQINIEDMNVTFKPLLPLSTSDEFTLIVY